MALALAMRKPVYFVYRYILNTLSYVKLNVWLVAQVTSQTNATLKGL